MNIHLGDDGEVTDQFLTEFRNAMFLPHTLTTVLVYSLIYVNRNQFVVPPVKLPMHGGHFSFSVSGATIWNSFPHYLRDPTLTLDIFRCFLKSYLFAHH